MLCSGFRQVPNRYRGDQRADRFWCSSPAGAERQRASAQPADTYHGWVQPILPTDTHDHSGVTAKPTDPTMLGGPTSGGGAHQPRKEKGLCLFYYYNLILNCGFVLLLMHFCNR